MAQTATVSGVVTIEANSKPLHAAKVLLSPLGRVAETNDQGEYRFTDVAPGTYDLVAQSPGLAASRQTIRVTAGGSVSADFKLRLDVVHETITVTASGREESTLRAIQSVTQLDVTSLPLKSSASMGDVLDHESGVSKRSAGPGSGRPVVRGFDGDRVLILEDGVSTGTLSYQSGDHGEPIDVNKLERLEVVRGPATLLYGSNAIGGVVNAVSRHDTHQHADPGVRGYVTGLGGSNNGLGGGSAGVEVSSNTWQFWGSGGGQRTGAYKSSEGTVQNSHARTEQVDAGLGRYGARSFFSFNYGLTDSRYGIPVDPDEVDAEVPNLLLRRHNFRFTGGFTETGGFENISFKLNYSDYNHQEVVDGATESQFFNKQFTYRAAFQQKKRGRWTGIFGASGLRRDYKVDGSEALAPPTRQDSFALFAMESLDFESTRLQLGGRVERTAYDPIGLRARTFTGFSAAVGVSQRLWKDGSFLANYTHSYRAPAQEELYNLGPHPGNATFEIGDPDLNPERNNGLDLALRHLSSRVHAEVAFFYYRIGDFVYLAPTGNVQDGLTEANYAQSDSRFVGGEAKLELGLHRNLWLNLGADSVNARLTSSKEPLPRIPPVRGRAGVDLRFKGVSLRPELVLSNAQKKTFSTETSTAGYSVLNFVGSYTVARQHALHLISAEVFNAGDRFYRNHLSFIKSFAPEIGRGVRFSYTVQFF